MHEELGPGAGAMSRGNSSEACLSLASVGVRERRGGVLKYIESLMPDHKASIIYHHSLPFFNIR